MIGLEWLMMVTEAVSTRARKAVADSRPTGIKDRTSKIPVDTVVGLTTIRITIVKDILITSQARIIKITNTIREIAVEPEVSVKHNKND